MGYRITYEPVKKVRMCEKRHSSVAALTGAFFLVFLILVNLLWPAGAETLREVFLPGDEAVTAAALEKFAADLGAGEGFYDAAQTFCLTILEHEAAP